MINSRSCYGHLSELLGRVLMKREAHDVVVDSRPSENFTVGEFLVEPALNRITGPNGPVQVEPRIMAVLVALAAHPGAVMSRSELLATVWHDSVVNDETLTRAVFHLRRHFGDDSDEPLFIETIRKGGYRLVAPVRSVSKEAGQLQPTPGPLENAPSLERKATRGYRRGPLGLASLIVGLALLSLARWLFQGDQPSPTPPTVVSLTSYPGNERHPSISADGSLVAFTMTDAAGWVDLYVRHVERGSLLRLTNDSSVETYSTWSPGGSQIAFVKKDNAASSIYLVSAIGGTPTRLLAEPYEVSGISWSPDGQSLAYSAHPDTGGPRAVFVIPTTGGEDAQLTLPPARSLGDRQPRFAPDGTHVAFVRADPAGNEDLWLVPIAGGSERRLTRGQIRVRGHAWDVGGSHLVYSTLARGPFRLWRLNVLSGEEAWLPIPGEGAMEPAIAGDAGTLVYVESRIEANVWRAGLAQVNTRGLNYESLIRSTLWDFDAHYSPDGSRLAFTSTRSGALEIWIADRDGRNTRQLTTFGGPVVSTPRWSPDGRQIAFTAGPTGKFAVYVVDLAGGPPRQLTDGRTNEQPSSWSRDGQSIYVASDQTDGWQIWRVQVDGTARQQLTAGGGREAYEDSAGSWLYVSRPEQPGLWRLPVGSVETGLVEGVQGLPESPMEAVFDDVPYAGYDNWLVRGNRFFAMAAEDEVPYLLQIDLLTGVRQHLADLPGIASPTLDVSPDVGHVVYNRIDQSESDLRLIRDPRWRAEGQ